MKICTKFRNIVKFSSTVFIIRWPGKKNGFDTNIKSLGCTIPGSSRASLRNKLTSLLEQCSNTIRKLDIASFVCQFLTHSKVTTANTQVYNVELNLFTSVSRYGLWEGLCQTITSKSPGLKFTFACDYSINYNLQYCNLLFQCLYSELLPFLPVLVDMAVLFLTVSLR